LNGGKDIRLHYGGHLSDFAHALAGNEYPDAVSNAPEVFAPIPAYDPRRYSAWWEVIQKELRALKESNARKDR
jgi:hypothetical protein